MVIAGDSTPTPVSNLGGDKMEWIECKEPEVEYEPLPEFKYRTRQGIKEKGTWGMLISSKVKFRRTNITFDTYYTPVYVLEVKTRSTNLEFEVPFLPDVVVCERKNGEEVVMVRLRWDKKWGVKIVRPHYALQYKPYISFAEFFPKTKGESFIFKDGMLVIGKTSERLIPKKIRKLVPGEGYLHTVDDILSEEQLPSRVAMKSVIASRSRMLLELAKAGVSLRYIKETEEYINKIQFNSVLLRKYDGEAIQL